MKQDPDKYVPSFFDKLEIFSARIFSGFVVLWLCIRHGFNFESIMEELDDRVATLRRRVWKLRTQPPKNFK